MKLQPNQLQPKKLYMIGTYSNQKGFTIIEFIMSIIILGIIGAMTFQVVSYGVEVYLVSEKRKELYDLGRLALERMVRETRTAGAITTPTVGNSGNTLIFNKSAYSYASGAPLDTSTTITFQLNGNNLERVGDISGTTVLASDFSSFSVTNETGNFLTLNVILYSTNGGTVSMRTKAYARNAPAAASGGGGTVRDNFDAQVYSNNDGSDNWSIDWAEIGETTDPIAGDERVMTDGSENYVLRVRDNDSGGEGVQREADLSGYTSAYLDFQYRKFQLDAAGDYVTIDVSANGGSSWTEIGRFSGPVNDASYQSFSYDISAYIASNTRIRFLTSSTMGGTDTVYFDDVVITYE